MLNAVGFTLYFVLLSATPFLWLLRQIAKVVRGRQGRGPSTYAQYWRNSLGNQFAVSRSVHRPTSREALVEIVRAAAGQRVRAVGSGHSFTDCAVADEIRLDMHGLNRPLDVDRDRKRVRVEAGMTIRELNQWLAGLKLALPNMGSYDVQTISGAISTATHGSGIAFGSLADLVRAAELVLDDGHVVHVQPKSGTEEPPSYAQAIRDDAAFQSVVVAMGSMGIIYAFTLEVRDAFALRETCELVEWTEVVARLGQGVLREHEHWEVLVNPYLTGKSERWCLVTTRNTDHSGAGLAGPRVRHTAAAIVTGVPIFDQVILWLLGHFPSQTPRLIKSSLGSLVDKSFVSASYDVFNLGNANLVPAFSSELGFPLESTHDGVAPFLQAADRLFELADQAARHGRWHTVPISLRFVRGSPHYLSPQHGRDTCMIEIPMLLGAKSGWDLLQYYERRLLPMGARPHWGQANWFVGAENVRTLYSDFPAWLSALKRFNPRGTFDGPFTDRLGVSVRRAAAQGKSRAAEDSTVA